MVHLAQESRTCCPSFETSLTTCLATSQGVEYEVTAFQAVNAAGITGKTIHHACGLNLGTHQPDETVTHETSKRMSFWRWLIIDEISMVSARLLARVEQRLRAVMPSAGPWKHNPDGTSRPFGGINVIFIGDFLQLPPPEGGNISDIPHRFKTAITSASKTPDPLADYGRELFWCGAVQGMTELTERERCKDEWWNEVVDELREGRLSEKNYNYLLGKPVPDSTLPAEERTSRCRLIDGPKDERLQAEKFDQAFAIVANNDARYQINKDRSLHFACEAGVRLRWSVAQDIADAQTLQAEDCDKDTKIRWLQYHDRDTGDLCGMLPLALGMHVALTDHIDRSEKLLLQRKSWAKCIHSNGQRQRRSQKWSLSSSTTRTWRLAGNQLRMASTQ